MKEKTNDAVNHPSHYNTGNIEVINTGILTHAKISLPNFGKSLILGFIAVSVVYVMTYFADVLWALSPRVWKVQLNVLVNPLRWRMFLTYFPFYLLFFGIFNFSQTIGLKIEGQSEAAFTRLSFPSRNLFNFTISLTAKLPSPVTFPACF